MFSWNGEIQYTYLDLGVTLHPCGLNYNFIRSLWSVLNCTRQGESWSPGNWKIIILFVPIIVFETAIFPEMVLVACPCEIMFDWLNPKLGTRFRPQLPRGTKCIEWNEQQHRNVYWDWDVYLFILFLSVQLFPPELELNLLAKWKFPNCLLSTYLRDHIANLSNYYAYYPFLLLSYNAEWMVAQRIVGRRMKTT